jgi:hypothetical protein
MKALSRAFSHPSFKPFQPISQHFRLNKREFKYLCDIIINMNKDDNPKEPINYRDLAAEYRHRQEDRKYLIPSAERERLVAAKRHLLRVAPEDPAWRDISFLLEIDDVRTSYIKEQELGFDPWHCYGKGCYEQFFPRY